MQFLHKLADLSLWELAGTNFSPLCCLIFPLIFCCWSSCGLPTPGEPFARYAIGYRWQGGGSSSRLSPGVGCSRKDTVFCGAVSLAQALIWERVSLTAELKLSPCFVYASILPGLCLLLGRKRPAKTPPALHAGCIANITSRLFDESSALDRQQLSQNSLETTEVSLAGWMIYSNVLLPLGVALQVFQPRSCKSFHLVQILDCERRWPQRGGLFKTPFKNLPSFQQINAAWICE